MVIRKLLVLFLVLFGVFVIPVNAQVVNGGFASNDFTGWSFSGVDDYYVPTASGGYANIVNDKGHSAWTTMYQTVNVTSYDYLEFQYKGSGANQNGDVIYVNIGGEILYLDELNTTWNTYQINVSELTNNVTLTCAVGSRHNWLAYGLFDDVFLYTGDVGDTYNISTVQWNQYPYHTGETATLTTCIANFDNATYSYYLDLYNTQEYLTTYEITSETEYNYYTFPLDWTDTSLLAKLMRVTDPYATDEVQLAYDISHFETLDFDTTVSFNKSSYNPSESLKVTWSGAANGSSVWLRAGDDGEVIESDVAYSGSFTFNIPANTTETYYIVDVITGGYSQVQASCMISSIPDFFFNYSVAVDQDEYSPGDIVNVTYSTDQNGQIQVVKTISDNIYHSIGFTSGAINATGLFYITEDEPYGFYDVYLLDSSNSILDSVRYALLPSTSSLEILQSSVYLHESFVVFAQTVNESILSIEDPDGIEVWNKSIDALMYDSIYYTPTIKTGVYTAYLYDDYTLSDTILVYYADDPDVPDDDVIDDVIEDILEDDESMTDYFDDKFREFAPTAWGIFLLSIILWLMAILTSFGGSSKRR